MEGHIHFQFLCQVNPVLLPFSQAAVWTSLPLQKVGPHRKWSPGVAVIPKGLGGAAGIALRLLSGTLAGFSFKMQISHPHLLPKSLSLNSWCSFLSPGHYVNDDRWFLIVTDVLPPSEWAQEGFWRVVARIKIFQEGRGLLRWDGAPVASSSQLLLSAQIKHVLMNTQETT